MQDQNKLTLLQYILISLKIFVTKHVCFQEKGKYDVLVGNQKDPEGVAEFWAEMLGRYPSVIAIIDPLRKQVRYWTTSC